MIMYDWGKPDLRGTSFPEYFLVVPGWQNMQQGLVQESLIISHLRFQMNHTNAHPFSKIYENTFVLTTDGINIFQLPSKSLASLGTVLGTSFHLGHLHTLSQSDKGGCGRPLMGQTGGTLDAASRVEIRSSRTFWNWSPSQPITSHHHKQSPCEL